MKRARIIHFELGILSSFPQYSKTVALELTLAVQPHSFITLCYVSAASFVFDGATSGCSHVRWINNKWRRLFMGFSSVVSDGHV